METSEADVYAAGDISAFPLKQEGGTVTRIEHVGHARLSAAHAMAEMLKPGSTDEYDYLPYFYSRVFDLHWDVSHLQHRLHPWACRKRGVGSLRHHVACFRSTAAVQVSGLAGLRGLNAFWLARWRLEPG